ncbi:hypothetical protein RGQ15_19770 [Paracoccus sp. MBLB3053]|uniref:Uncharacterized protein n=1 Tax=Paracoccus aurantius TaxID=3073814 RepID=A0ABU2HXN0_9RHOB|nr:hypothetical protein [Paracoccus sp. MBLB3053]MDS9469801.1 hypothetical protein [Paracoccus sp. MBLB3053]
MSEQAPGTRTANQRFDALWEEIGAKRLIIGDEDEGVEIRVDADLSIFGILDRLKEAANREHEKGEISKDEQKIVTEALEQTASKLSGGIYDKLNDHFAKLLGKRS